MTDNDLRGIILKMFYDVRKTNQINRLKYEEIADVNKNDYNRIGKQLSDNGLIEWWQPISGSGSGRITANGVDVIEGVSKAPISINLDARSFSVSGSQNVIIGNNNTQSNDIDINIEYILREIDKSNASAEDKKEAKSLFEKLTTNSAFASIVTAIIAAGTGGAS